MRRVPEGILAAILLAIAVVLAGCSAPVPGTEVVAPGPGGGGAGRSFPDASSTGVPAGTKLTDYAGPCTITAGGTVIDAKTVRCTLVILAADVVISRSMVLGQVVLDTDRQGSSNWSATLTDTEIDAGLVQEAAVGSGNMNVLRADIRGGATSVRCGELAKHCSVRDSWLHGQRIPPGTDWHLGGFLSNGGSNVELVHNTVLCEPAPTSVGGGCTGDINLFGDFAPVSRVNVIGNLLGANVGNSFCTYGGDAASKKFPASDNVVYRDNVFERGANGKCGSYGPVSSFNRQRPGNVWENNVWDDGAAVEPSD